jgi:uncharacterized phage protein gp47/JayE
MATVIDSTGLTRDRLDQIVANLEALWKSVNGADIDVSPSSADGQLIGALAEAFSTLGQLLETVYLGRSVAGAIGASLSRLVLLNGITRNPATYSTANVTFTGVNGTLIPAGSLIDATNDPPSHFVTTANVTIDSTGKANGTVRATTLGPVFADIGQITAIKTSIAGWTSVTNAAPVNLGAFDETDAALRRRRQPSVASQSKGIIDGIYAALANIHGVSEAAVFENKTGSPISRPGSADLPANSLQVVVLGGSTAEIGAAIWAKASAGVTLVGGTTVPVVDSQGQTQLIKFDRPTSTAIYVSIFLVVPVGVVVSDALRLSIKNAVVTYGVSTSKIGGTVVRARLFAPVLDAVAAIATKSVIIFIGTAPAPFSTSDIAVPFLSRATWDIGNIDINVTSS